MTKSLPKVFSLALVLALIVSALPVFNSPAQAISTTIVISQVYGGGGNTGAPYTHDFVELFNRGTTTVSLSGWSIQYASATGTGNFAANTAQITPLSGSLNPGQYLLVQEAASSVGAPLPTPDVTDLTPIAMAAGAGKVALVNTTTPLGCNGSSTQPCSPSALASIVDLVGYGNANFFEGSGAAPTLSNTTGALRLANGCTDTDNNSTDFVVMAPSPRNTASPLNLCPPAEPKVNEFVFNHISTDTNEYVEVFGTPNINYSTYSLVQIEGDFSLTATGTIDSVTAVGTTNASGFWQTGFLNNVFENGTVTLLLVQNFTGSVGSDLDTNDDGTLDSTPWTAIADAVAINDGGATDLTYGIPVLGVAYDGQPFAPGGASRIPDGNDTNAAANWVRNDFDLAGIPGFPGTPVAGEALNTPGATNQAITVTTNTVTIASTDGDAAETGSDTGNFRVSRTGSTTSAVTVNYTISGGASAADYTPLLGGTVVITSGSAFTDILITPVDDPDIEGPETLTLTLTAGSGYVLGASTSASVTIADNDAAVVITRISTIQDSDDTSTPGTFTVEAIVVGDYQTQGSGQLRGFFIQEENADVDANPATSEGIFVFCTTCPTAVNVGDKVRVTGASSEFFGMSQLSATTAGSVTVLNSGNLLPTPASVTLPITGVPTGDLTAATSFINAYFEKFEGMLVTFPSTLSVSEYFELARFGQLILSANGRPRQFTDANLPSVAGYVDHQINLASRTVILDDTDNLQNGNINTPNTPYYYPQPGGLSTGTGRFFRGGDTIADLTGVLHWSFNGLSGEDAWRIRPVSPTFNYTFSSANPRPVVPDVDGTVKVASFNVLNYFLTVDITSSNDVGSCGASGELDCRGADSAQELDRQRTKMLAALSAIDADVFGFMEMENTDDVEPLADIVAGLSGYDYIDTGVIGGDAIRVGIIYKTSSVMPVGDFAILDSSVDARFIDTRNRPALAQTFEEVATGARFTVVVNHLKSKGSGCGSGDDDTTTGQGNCNGTRTQAAEALADWLATDPTDSGDPDVLIIGDMNSYAKEDPIVTLQEAGFTDMVAAFGAPNAYGYVFDGQLGYLDHALANASLTPQVAEVAEWHINADEIPLFDYNDDIRDPGERDAFEEESDTLPLYEPNAFRTSDHDPVIIGLDLINQPPTADALGPYTVVEGGSVTLNATGVDPEGTAVTFEWDLDNNGSFETSGQSVNFSAASITAPATLTVTVKVTDAFGNFAVDDTTVSVLYNFAGFFQPVDNSPIVNSVKAGQGIPVKFSLNGDHGLNIFAAGYPKFEFTSCPSTSVDPVETTVTAGNSSLSYDATTDQYTYIWKTDKTWAGKCGTLLVMFNDGTTQTALFKFTK